MTEHEISRVIVDGAIEVHRTVGGPGRLESIYEAALAYELELRGLKVERQKVVPVLYDGQRLATERPSTARPKIGLVINFGEQLAKDGIHRVVNRL